MDVYRAINVMCDKIELIFNENAQMECGIHLSPLYCICYYIEFGFLCCIRTLDRLL